MLGRSVNLTTLFLDRLRPPKWLTSTLCTYFCQSLTTALLESAEEKRKYVARLGIEPKTPDFRVRRPTDCTRRPGSSLLQHSEKKENILCCFFPQTNVWIYTQRLLTFVTNFQHFSYFSPTFISLKLLLFSYFYISEAPTFLLLFHIKLL